MWGGESFTLMSCFANCQINFIFSRLEKVLQSDEAKTFLGDVLGSGNSSNISDGEMTMMTNIEDSQCIATQGLCPSSHITEQIKQNVQSSVSCNEDIQNSSGESDVEKKVELIQYFLIKLL